MSAALLLLLAAPPPSYALDRKKVAAEVREDFDGDYQEELAVVIREGKRHRVLILEEDKEDEKLVYQLIFESAPRTADRVLRFEARRVAGDRFADVVTVLEERQPDESVQHLRIIGRVNGQLVEMAAQVFSFPRRDRPAGEVALGDDAARFELIDLEKAPPGEGAEEIVWFKDPKKLLLADGPSPVTVVIGMEKQVYRLREGRFVADEVPVIEDFAARKLEWTVEATSQIPRIWGTAQAFWGADGDLTTAWSVDTRDGAVGQALSVGFDRPEPVRLMRVVPGCARDPESWDAHDRIAAFSVTFSDGLRVAVDLDKLDVEKPGVRGVGVFPLEEGFGAQVLVLFENPRAVRWARFEIDRLAPSTAAAVKQVRETCVSELSLH